MRKQNEWESVLMAVTEKIDWSRRCGHCGEIIPDDAHWRREFCSTRCANAYFNGLTGQARAEARARLRCVVCDEPIVGAERSDKKYCSDRCARTVHEATFVAKKPEKHCAHCGATFRSQFATAKFCSPACYNAARRGADESKSGFACEATSPERARESSGHAAGRLNRAERCAIAGGESF